MTYLHELQHHFLKILTKFSDNLTVYDHTSAEFHNSHTESIGSQLACFKQLPCFQYCLL